MTRKEVIAVTLCVFLAFIVSAIASSTEEAFNHADKNRDGTLDREEFAALADDIYDELSDYLGDKSKYLPVSKVDFSIPLPELGPGFWEGFVSSVGMIIATEIGDKTFFIAAIMAMQYSRLFVFLGAISALAVMTILSAALGFALPNILPREYTHYAGALLFLYFGMKMLKEGFDADGGGPSEELAEVEQELSLKRVETDSDIEQFKSNNKSQLNHFPKGPLTIITQGFTLTFLAEWGDRSQIATIALAAAKDVVGVTMGGILGHTLCTGMAVIGGRLLAARISERTVHIFGGALFVVFGLHSLLFGL